MINCGYILLLFLSSLKEYLKATASASESSMLSIIRTIQQAVGYIRKSFTTHIQNRLIKVRFFRYKIRFVKYAYCVMICMHGAQMCHVVTAATSPTASPTIKSPTFCSNGICYWLSTSTTSWNACNTTCNANQAQMLCIQSATQNTAVSQAITGRTYLGIVASKTVGSYSWQNGCVSSYTNWLYSTPSNQVPYAGFMLPSTYSSPGNMTKLYNYFVLLPLYLILFVFIFLKAAYFVVFFKLLSSYCPIYIQVRG